MAVSFENVSFSYDSSRPSIEKASFFIEDNDYIAVVGPNGGGKTTLIKLMLGLLQPDSGVIKIFERNPQFASKLIGYVPQNINFDTHFPITVRELVLMGRVKFSLFSRCRFDSEDHSIVGKYIEMLKLTEIQDHPIGSISGGQLQRALIARALVGQPGILVLDEPTANIDPTGEMKIFEWLSTLNDEVTIVLVTHDIAMVSHHIERVICVNHQVTCHKTKHLSPDDLDKLYGEHVHLIDHGHDHGHRNGH